MSTAADKTKKAPADHPKYLEMIAAAITELKDRTGSSRQAIVKYIKGNYKVGDSCDTHVKLALKRGVASGDLLQVKGSGASGSFKVVKKTEPKKAPKPKSVTKKPVAKPKKPTTTKSPKKKSGTPKKSKKAAGKKPVTKKSPKKPAKKPAAKKPAKKSKPAAKKPAAKKPAAKKQGKKPAKK
jgi:type IV secretory pathway VirB10-like protein